MNIWRAMWGFDGRISRKYFWLAGLVWTIGFLAIMLPLLHAFTGGEWMSDTIGDREIREGVERRDVDRSGDPALSISRDVGQTAA